MIAAHMSWSHLMPRSFLAIFALLPTLALIGCESPDAFPYDPDLQTTQTSPAASTTAPASQPTSITTTKNPPSVDSSALAALQGEWMLVSLIKDGKTVTTGESQAGKL